MNIAIALRTCGSVHNYWGVKRIVDDSKDTIILTCLNSLLKSIKASKHNITLSIHDDNSGTELLKEIDDLCNSHGCQYQLINSGRMLNFETQYEWLNQQDCDYLYMVEDDYLHRENAIDDMVDVCEDMKKFWNGGEYAVLPMNCQNRYNTPESHYPSFVLRGRNGYWRSVLHSTSTFFMSKNASIETDEILRTQAYSWKVNGSPEHEIINKLWQSDRVRLLSPIHSLAWHLSDDSCRDIIYNWEEVWKSNLIESNNDEVLK